MCACLACCAKTHLRRTLARSSGPSPRVTYFVRRRIEFRAAQWLVGGAGVAAAAGARTPPNETPASAAGPLSAPASASGRRSGAGDDLWGDVLWAGRQQVRREPQVKFSALRNSEPANGDSGDEISEMLRNELTDAVDTQTAHIYVIT